MLATLEIVGPWEVTFPPNLGAPPSRMFEELVSWTTIPDDGIKYCSGTATYLKQFEVPASMLAHGDRLELDLGQLRNVAEATLNGKPLGIRRKPPCAGTWEDPREEKAPLAWRSFVASFTPNPLTLGDRWNEQWTRKSGSLVTLPEYYRLDSSGKKPQGPVRQELQTPR